MLNRPIQAAVLLPFIVVILFLHETAFAQPLERSLDKLSWRTEPIKIVKIKANGTFVEFGREFQAEDDWLKGLTVTAQNISHKTIARIELTLAVPPPKGAPEKKPTIVVPMVFGRDPSLASPSEVLELVSPGERVEIKLLEANLPSLRADFEQLGYGEKITHAQIRTRSVVFIDGSEWIGDEILYPNPNNPKERLNPNK